MTLKKDKRVHYSNSKGIKRYFLSPIITELMLLHAAATHYKIGSCDEKYCISCCLYFVEFRVSYQIELLSDSSK